MLITSGTWITFGIIAASFSLFAIPYGFYLKSIEKSEPSNNPIIISRESPDKVNIKSIPDVDIMLDKTQLKPFELIEKQYTIAMKIPGSVTKTSSLASLAKKAMNAGFYDLAFKVALDIPGSVTQTSVLSSLSIKAGESGHIDKAVQYAEKITGSVTKTSTLNKLASM